MDPSEATRRANVQRYQLRSGDAETRRGQILLGLRIAGASASEPVRAVTYLGPSGFLTYSPPHRFVGSTGRVYLVKERAQQGLGAEAFANDLARLMDAGPDSTVIEVSAEALPADGRLAHLRGKRVATVELEDAFNHYQLERLGYAPDPSKIDWASWARVVAFQTWVRARDPQAVLRATDGRVFSVDHGDCFSELLPGRPSGLIVPALRGVAGTAFDRGHLASAASALVAVSEGDLVRIAARLPDDPGWRMPIERKVHIIEWLLDRQPGIGNVIGWTQELS